MQKGAYEISFTREDIRRITESNGTMFTGTKNEIIVKHLLEQLPDVKSVSEVKRKNENINKGDIRFKYKGNKHYMEVKTGRYFDNKYKLSIDCKYVLKDRPNEKYEQSTGRPWLYALEYDCMAIVFSHRVYIIHYAESFLDTVTEELRANINDSLVKKWYETNDTPLFEGATGSMNRYNKKYDTFIMNIDLDYYLEAHNIPHTILEYDTRATI